MSIHESGQMYLETIYILSQNKSYVRAIDVGEHLGYSKPSVSRAMSIRHTVLSEMLMRLGVDEKTATEDACRIEHVISEQSFSAIQQHLKWTVEQVMEK